MADIKQIIQDLILPEFRTIQSEIHRLDDKFNSFREEFRSEIRRLDNRIDSLEKQIQVIREDFKLALDIHERLAALEAKIQSHS